MKKNWMKLLALALSVLTVMSLLAACGIADKDDDDEDKVRGTVSQAAQDDTTAAAQDPVADTTAAAETTGSDEKTFSTGSSANGSYENAFIGIGFNAPTGWTFYTDDQIKELNQATASMMDEEYAELIANAAVIYDMMVQDPTTGNSVNVTLEKATAASIALLDLETYLTNNVSAVSQALSGMGLTVTENKIIDVTLGGIATKGLWLKCSVSGIEMYELVIPIKCGSYLANVTVATIGADTTADVLANFYAVN